MTDPLTPILQRQGVVILDGGLATELERRGADLDDGLWSAKMLLEAPGLIEQIHYDYFAAGADVAITASYQATFEGLSARGVDRSRAADLLRLSVRLACDARDRYWEHEGRLRRRSRPLVAASVGSYGAYLADGSEYRGDYGLSATDLAHFHRPRLEVLASSGADLLACETIPCLIEAEALVGALEQVPGARAWLSFSCRDETRVCHGESLRECVALGAASPQVLAAGLNCTPPRFVEPLLRSVEQPDLPLLAYPNSGERWDAARRRWVAGTGEAFAPEEVINWYHAGARLIGGCCRTTPSTIRDIAAALVGRGRPDEGRGP